MAITKSGDRNIFDLIMNQETYLPTTKYYGLYRGRVDYNQDPQGLGRIKVRVFQIHNTEQEVPVDKLYWAWPLNTHSGPGSGSFSVPPVGSNVVVMFEGGDPKTPWYVGGYHRLPNTDKQYGVNEANKKLFYKRDRTMQGNWTYAAQSEVPWEAQLQLHNEPTTTVLLKTQKGHTIYAEERDEFEHFRIIDRQGQTLSFDGPITTSKNKNNAARRINQSSLQGNAFDNQEYSPAGVASISLVDAGQQRLQLRSGVSEETVLLESRTPLTEATNTSEDVHYINLSAGQRKTSIVCLHDGEVMGEISIDASIGSITINTQKTVEINAENVSLDSSNISLRGDTHISGDLTIAGSVISSGEIIGSR